MSCARKVSLEALRLGQLAADRRFAQSLARGLAVLGAFQPGDGPLGNQELASRTGLSKATISRLTFTLTELGYLERLAAVEKYRLGTSVIALGHVANACLPFLVAAAPVMQRLADEVGALVAIAVPDGDRMLMTHEWHPSRSSSEWFQAGTRFPMTRSAVGLAYLASTSTRERHRVVRTVLAQSEEEAGRIYTEVERARASIDRHGFVPSFGRWKPGICAAATPLRSAMLGAPYIVFTGVSTSAVDEDYLHDVIGPMLARRVDLLARS